MAFFKVYHLTAEFGGIRAVDDVSFTVRQGQVYSIIGPNGAGKTTIFNLISRIYDASHGSILFQNRDITTLPPHHIAALGIARTFQNIELFQGATVLQNLLVGRHPHCRSGLLSELLFLPSLRREERAQRAKVEEVMTFLGLLPYRDQTIANLSYGVRKVIELGRALCTEPRLLLLDEPSSGLSAEETGAIAHWIEHIKHTLGITVIMVEHDMNLVTSVSDRVLVLNDGRVLAEGGPAEVQRA